MMLSCLRCLVQLRILRRTSKGSQCLRPGCSAKGEKKAMCDFQLHQYFLYGIFLPRSTQLSTLISKRENDERIPPNLEQNVLYVFRAHDPRLKHREACLHLEEKIRCGKDLSVPMGITHHSFVFVLAAQDSRRTRGCCQTAHKQITW